MSDGLYYKKGNIAPFTGIVTDGVERGRLKSGLMEGLRRTYWEGGQLMQEGHYTNGKAEGTHLSYYRNSKLMSKTIFKSDKVEGPAVYYHDNGQLWFKGEFKNAEERAQITQKISFR